MGEQRTYRFKEEENPLLIVAYWQFYCRDARHRSEAQDALEAQEKARVAYEQAQQKFKDAQRRTHEIEQDFVHKAMLALNLPRVDDSFEESFVYMDEGDVYFTVRPK